MPVAEVASKIGRLVVERDLRRGSLDGRRASTVPVDIEGPVFFQRCAHAGHDRDAGAHAGWHDGSSSLSRAETSIVPATMVGGDASP